MKLAVLAIGLLLAIAVPAMTYQLKSSFHPSFPPLPSLTPADIILPLEYTVITETPVPSATPRPTVTVIPTPNKISAGDLEAFFSKYADKESVDRELLKKIAVCESGFNQAARNGIYGGLFQFSENSWQNLRRMMNLNPDPELRYSAEESVRTAAYKLAINGREAWPNCSQ